MRALPTVQTPPAPVQTRCACGHSVAAHVRPGVVGTSCQGLTFYTPTRANRVPAIELCDCLAVVAPYTVPAATR